MYNNLWSDQFFYYGLGLYNSLKAKIISSSDVMVALVKFRYSMCLLPETQAMLPLRPVPTAWLTVLLCHPGLACLCGPVLAHLLFSSVPGWIVERCSVCCGAQGFQRMPWIHGLEPSLDLSISVFMLTEGAQQPCLCEVEIKASCLPPGDDRMVITHHSCLYSEHLSSRTIFIWTLCASSSGFLCSHQHIPVVFS